MELLLCSIFTILPDYLFRRLVQGKRLGHEITIFSVWYELRWGIASCVILTVSLITLILFYHPASKEVVSYFRTVTVLPEGNGRVEEVFVGNNQRVKKGDVLFRLDDSVQQAEVESARRKIAEIDAALKVAEAELVAASAEVDQASAALDEATEEYARNKELLDEGSAAVRETEVERLFNLTNQRRGALAAAQAQLAVAQSQIDDQIPAQRATAQSELSEAETKLAKRKVEAGVDGRLEQFGLRVGDVVNPLLRPAGILVPDSAKAHRFAAGFGQLAANVVRPGMYVEMGCRAKPLTVVPMVVVDRQDVLGSGQFRPTDGLLDVSSLARAPGSVLAYLEPLYPGQADGIPPGSVCMANAYSRFDQRLDDPDLGITRRLYYRVVEEVGLVHAILLRIEMLLLPVKTLVFSSD
jgi:multidrug resistance efflux pump